MNNKNVIPGRAGSCYGYEATGNRTGPPAQSFAQMIPIRDTATAKLAASRWATARRLRFRHQSVDEADEAYVSRWFRTRASPPNSHSTPLRRTDLTTGEFVAEPALASTSGMLSACSRHEVSIR